MVQPALDTLTKRCQVGQHRLRPELLGASCVQVGALPFERLTLFRQLPTSLAQLIQADGVRLIGVEQPSVGSDQPVEVRLQPLFSCLFAMGSWRATGRQASVLRQKLLRIGKKGADMIPDRTFQPIAINLSARTGGCTGGVDEILAGTAIIASFTTSACL